MTLVPFLKEALKAPALLKEIYGDLAKPGVTQVGKALSTVFGLGNTLLWPVALLNEKTRLTLEKNMEKFREQLNETPEKEVSEVPPEIGVPIAEKLGYISNKELSDLYVNLLAKASTFNTSSLAHPGFVNIINNLSPDEALLLERMKNWSSLAFMELRLEAIDTSRGVLEHQTLCSLMTGLEVMTTLTFPKNIELYMSNFEGLGLIKIRRDIFIVNPKLYNNLKELYHSKFEAIEYDKEKWHPKYLEGKIEITPFGRLFIDACCRRLKNEGLRPDDLIKT